MKDEEELVKAPAERQFKHVLLVEDDSLVARALVRQLKRHAYVTVARSVIEAKTVMAHPDRHFDCAITDFNIGEGTADDIPWPDGLPVVLMSGDFIRASQSQTANRAVYVTAKPLDVAALLPILEKQ